MTDKQFARLMMTRSAKRLKKSVWSIVMTPYFLLINVATFWLSLLTLLVNAVAYTLAKDGKRGERKKPDKFELLLEAERERKKHGIDPREEVFSVKL